MNASSYVWASMSVLHRFKPRVFVRVRNSCTFCQHRRYALSFDPLYFCPLAFFTPSAFSFPKSALSLFLSLSPDGNFILFLREYSMSVLRTEILLSGARVWGDGQTQVTFWWSRSYGPLATYDKSRVHHMLIMGVLMTYSYSLSCSQVVTKTNLLFLEPTST